MRGLLAVLLLAVLVVPSAALDEMQDQETVAELLATPPPPPEERQKELSERRWAVLPEIGYGPDTGPKAGVKFQHRNFADLGIDFDVHGSYARNQQQSLKVALGTPHLLDDRVLVLFRVGYEIDPQLDFFGVGNNDVGPDPASTHSFQRAVGSLTVGWRPWSRLALNAGIGLRHVRIGHGDRDDDRPFTLDAFPRLAGNEGGFVNPLSLSLVWSTRDGVVRPTRGWRAILVVTHTNKAMLSDFEFTRYVADLSYMFPLWSERHVLGLRLGGGYVDGPHRGVPFWELEELGGDDTLRGFFPHRFLGTSRVVGTVEYRAQLFAFDFFKLWHVQVDGVAFGEAGRVFIARHVLREDFGLNDRQLAQLESALRYSGGGGVRFALSRALIARIDVGFSEEEKGLVYLTFGHTF